MSAKKILLFDFDGVIVDTMKDWHAVVNEIEDQPVDLGTFRTWHNGNVHQLDKTPEEMENYTVKEGDPYMAAFLPRLAKLSPIEHVHALIPLLAKEFDLYVVTSSTSQMVHEFLKKHGIGDCFQRVLGADVHYSKTRKIRDLLNRLNLVAEDAVFITDTLGDIREGTKAGVQSIAVTWGFHERADLEKGNPYATVDTAEELQEKVQSYFRSVHKPD